MTRPSWKNRRATSLVHALRMCKEYAQARRNLSIERLADRMGVSHDSLYKWLATGRLPAILLPAFELACGVHYASEWLAANADRMVVQLPKGAKAEDADLVAMSRPFIREPGLIARWLSGDHAPAACTNDNLCFAPARTGEGVYCVTERRLAERDQTA